MKILVLTTQPLLGDYLALLSTDIAVEMGKQVNIDVLDHYPSEADFANVDCLVTDMRLMTPTPVATVIALCSAALKGTFPEAGTVLWGGDYVSTSGATDLLEDVISGHAQDASKADLEKSTETCVATKARLSKRQKQLMKLLNLGYGNRRIADEIGRAHV